MARPFTGSERGRLKLKISRLYLKGLRQNDIAKNLGCSQSTISEYIKDLSNDWMREGVFNFDAAKRDELAKINAVELEAWEAWMKSKGLKRRTTNTIKTGGVQGDTDEESIVKWRENGDPRYLATIQWCINKRCEILGIDAPKKMEMDGPAFRSLTDWVQAVTENVSK